MVSNSLRTRGNRCTCRESCKESVRPDADEDEDRISSRLAYDNTMQPYNVTRILTPDVRLDMDAYIGYSRVFMSYAFRF